jgi:hypothetical protein
MQPERREGPNLRVVHPEVALEVVDEINRLGDDFVDTVVRYNGLVRTAAVKLVIEVDEAAELLEEYIDVGGHPDGLFAWLARKEEAPE